MKIKKGDEYLCIKSIILDDNTIPYSKGYYYKSEVDGCITTNSGDIEDVAYMKKEDFIQAFIKIKEIKASPYYNKISNNSYNVDMVNHPKHYNSHPSGVECLSIARHYCFSIGNAIKYLWRAGLKTDSALDNKEKEIEDLNKAIFYIKDRIKTLKNE